MQPNLTLRKIFGPDTRRSLSPAYTVLSLHQRKTSQTNPHDQLNRIGIYCHNGVIDFSGKEVLLTTFSFPEQPQTCIMQRCHLLALPMILNSLTGLLDLDLSHNQLTEALSFVQLPHLKRLNLSHNFIMTVEFWQSTHSLNEVNLSNNLLKALPCTKAAPLEKLDISVNQITVVCQCIGKISKLESEWTQHLKQGKSCKILLLSDLLRPTQGLDLLFVQACQRNYLGTIDALLTCKPDLICLQVRYTEKRKDSHLEHVESLVQHCYRKQFMRPYRLLVERGGLTHPKNRVVDTANTLLQLSVQRLDVENLNRLLNMGVQPTYIDEQGNTLLHLLFTIFDVEPNLAAVIAGKLLFHGVDPNQLNQSHWAAIHIAATNGQSGAISWAIRYNQGNYNSKFDLNKVGGKHGQSIVHIASHGGNMAILMMADELQLSVLEPNDQGYTPKDVASGNKAMQKLIKRQEIREIRQAIHQTQRQHPVSAATKKCNSSTPLEDDVNSSTDSNRRMPVTGGGQLKFKFLPKLQTESDGSDQEINEIPDSIGRFYQLSLQVPNSCTKQSISVINSHKTPDIWKLILSNPQLSKQLRHLLPEIQPVVLILLTILFFRNKHRQWDLRTYDLHFLATLKDLVYPPNLLKTMKGAVPEAKATWETNISFLREFVSQQISVYIASVQKEATYYNQKIKALKDLEPFNLISQRQLYHNNLSHDISNPFASLRCTFGTNVLNLLTLIQNTACNAFNLKVQSSHCNRLTIIQYESLQNVAFSHQIKPLEDRKRIFNQIELRHLGLTNNKSNIQITRVPILNITTVPKETTFSPQRH